MLKKILQVAMAAIFYSTLCYATSYQVSLNTSAFAGSSYGPFALDFQLTSGNPTSGVNNTVALSNFSFGSGSAGVGDPFSNSGNASGNLSSSVSLSTAGGSFFNEFSQYFNPGSILSFQLSLTDAPQSGTPDEFSFQLVDGTGNAINTTDPSGSGSILVMDLTGSSLQPDTYTTTADGFTVAPQLSITGSAVPEPATLLLAGGVIGGVFAVLSVASALKKAYPTIWGAATSRLTTNL